MANLSGIRAVVNKMREAGIILRVVGENQLTIHVNPGVTVDMRARQFLAQHRQEIIEVLLAEQRETTAPIGDHDCKFPSPIRDRNNVSNQDLENRGIADTKRIRFIRFAIEKKNGPNLRHRLVFRPRSR
jgi:hypothetical protein